MRYLRRIPADIVTGFRDMAQGLRHGLDSPDAWIVALLAACFILGFATRA